MPTQVLQQPQDLKVSVTALWLGRVFSGLAILFLLFDGAIKLVPLAVVTQTMDRIGYGWSEVLARSLGAITVACTMLYAVPPTSVVGAILLTGDLGGAIVSYLRIGCPLFTQVVCGLSLAAIASMIVLGGCGCAMQSCASCCHSTLGQNHKPGFRTLDHVRRNSQASET